MESILKKKLMGKVPVTGCFLNIYAPTLVELLGFAGFDFVVIDNEHGPFSWGEVEDLVRTAELAGVAPMVRVAYGPSDIQKALDRGAAGVHVPLINTKEQAETAVLRAKFPPLGTRGTAFSVRPANYGRKVGRSYLDQANRETLVVVHIETPQAVENIEEILKVRGIDVCFIGPTDLSVSMGYATEGPAHPEVRKAMDHVLSVGRKQGLPVGTLAGGAAGLQQMMRWGTTYTAVGITSLVNQALDAVVKAGAAVEAE